MTHRVASSSPLFAGDFPNFKAKSPVSWEPHGLGQSRIAGACWHIRSSILNSVLSFIALSSLSPSWNRKWGPGPWPLLRSRTWSWPLVMRYMAAAEWRRKRICGASGAPFCPSRRCPLVRVSRLALTTSSHLLAVCTTRPLSFVPLPSSVTAPKDVWVSGNLCGTPGRQEPLLLWKVSYGEQFHSFCTCPEAPDNTGINKTAVPVPPCWGCSEEGMLREALA